LAADKSVHGHDTVQQRFIQIEEDGLHHP
jgi:hypothetical protein